MCIEHYSCLLVALFLFNIHVPQGHHTALIIAASNGSTEVVRAILSVRGVKVNTQDKVTYLLVYLYSIKFQVIAVLFGTPPAPCS